MKSLLKVLPAFALLTFALTSSAVRAQDAPPPPPPDDQSDQGDQGDQGTSFQTFYDQLGDQGTWVQTDDYGYVFQPNVSDPNWAPYTDGHWVYTDVGWTWVSDEPWGWATYHYGRWVNIDGFGWAWVPGYRWAPAWVSWRYGGGYCGWAPLPPETLIGAEFGVGGDIGFRFGGDVDVSFNIGAGCYNFVSVGDLGRPNYRGAFIDRSRNYTIINNTTNVTNIKVINNYGTGAGANFRGVTANGPSLAEVNAHSSVPFRTVHLTTQNQPGRSNLQGDSLAVYAPRVNPATLHQAKPMNVSRTISHPVLNRGDSITKPLAVNATLKPAAPSPEAIQAAHAAMLHAPKTARIATENTRAKTSFTKPLTSMEPVGQTHPAVNTEHATQHAMSNNPSSGESVKPATTYHPETEVKPKSEPKPATTHHTESEVKPKSEPKPATSHHTESEVKPKSEPKPATTHHTESEVKPKSEPKPAAIHHTESEAKPKPEVHKTAPPAKKETDDKKP